MDKTLSIIGLPKLWNLILCTLLAAVTPTVQFVTAVVVAAFFNVWCGMRADGVVNIRCRNFSWGKFKYALMELLAFLFVIEVIAVVCHSMGDIEARQYACKTAAYLIIYCYIDNGLKNLCKAYPKSRGLWQLYLFVHLDFRRLIRIDELMDRYDEHVKKQKDEDNRKTTQEGDAPDGAQPEG